MTTMIIVQIMVHIVVHIIARIIVYIIVHIMTDYPDYQTDNLNRHEYEAFYLLAYWPVQNHTDH